jgi:hypothetical protein
MICYYESNALYRKFSHRIQILYNSYANSMNQKSLKIGTTIERNYNARLPLSLALPHASINVDLSCISIHHIFRSSNSALF